MAGLLDVVGLSGDTPLLGVDASSAAPFTDAPDPAADRAKRRGEMDAITARMKAARLLRTPDTVNPLPIPGVAPGAFGAGGALSPAPGQGGGFGAPSTVAGLPSGSGIAPGYGGGASVAPAPTPAPAMLDNRPPAAAPAATPAAASPAAAPQQPGLFNRIGNFLSGNSNTLLGLGAGLAGAPSLGMGFSRGFAGAQRGQQLDTAQGQLTDTVKALMSKGLSQQEAVAAAANPTIMQQMLAQIYGQPQIKDIENPDGSHTLVGVDPQSGSTYPLKQSPPPGTELPGSDGYSYVYRGGKWWKY